MKTVKVRATGEIFKANNDLDLLNQMRLNSFEPTKDVVTFMKQYAQRAVIAKNEDIRATDPKYFVEDLIKYHHIEYINDTTALN